ncbi:MAG: hypothetical protein Q9214_005322 [Letrouitia sp. 1 TL-2023]
MMKNGLIETATAAFRAKGDSSNAYLKLLQEHTEILRSNMFARLSSQMRQEKLVKHLKIIFEKSLQLDITKRDLGFIISTLESDLDVLSPVTPNPNTQAASQKTYTSANHGNLGTGSTPKGEGTSTSASTSDVVNVGSQSPAAEPATGSSPGAKESFPDELSNITSWKQRGYKFHWYSWGKIRDLDPSVQNFAYQAFTDNVGPDLFILAALHVNGYGCEINIEKSLQYLRHAARLGHHNSQTYMWRIFSSLSTSNSEIHGAEYLFNYAVNGSRTALEDLQIAQGPERHRLARGWLTDAYCGVGSWWLKDDEMLNGWTQSNLCDHEWCVKRQAENSMISSELIINKRGDTLLHGTAMCGQWMPFKSLVLDFKLDINTRNPLGETPLLSACRAGQGAVAILCLQRYDADASIAAKNGETPLHWLVSFTDENVEPLTKDLIAHGAVVDASTHERINHSAIPSDLDVDFQLPGTALKWAVHNNRPHIVRTLLAYGADPHWTSDDAIQSPVKWAAYYHHDECLRTIIEFLERKVTQTTTEGKKDLRFAITYGPLVVQAVYAADKFSTILRNGPQYLIRLHATLDLLREKTKMINFSNSFNGSMLYYAVSEAHDEVVEYMFKHSWCTDTLNTPTGNAKRTPILEAVRWNRSSLVQLLLGHGADMLALASNPFQPDQTNWSALHVFAHEGHNKGMGLVKALVEAGVPVDGAEHTPSMAPREDPSINQAAETVDISSLSLTKTIPKIMTCETPFAVALRHNAFNLATVLLQAGADPNALTISSGLFISPYPLTTLGHMIISNARYSSPRLRYLLNTSTPDCAFIVDPVRQLTALHRTAMAHQEIVKVEGGEVTRQEFDVETNADIMHELLLKWKGPEELNATCEIRGNTALHLAVEATNSRAVEALLRAGARRDVINEERKTALDIAEMMTEKTEKYAALVEILQS